MFAVVETGEHNLYPWPVPPTSPVPDLRWQRGYISGFLHHMDEGSLLDSRIVFLFVEFSLFSVLVGVICLLL